MTASQNPARARNPGRRPRAARRLIGLGNPLRGDDAAGLAVADRVEDLTGSRGADVRRCHGGAAELLDAWEGAQDVVVVDAIRSGQPPGTVRLLSTNDAAAARLGGGTHDAGLADALALGGALDRLPERISVYAIEVESVGLGHPLSAIVREAVEVLAGHLAGSLSLEEDA